MLKDLIPVWTEQAHRRFRGLDRCLNQSLHGGGFARATIVSMVTPIEGHAIEPAGGASCSRAKALWIT